MRTFDCGDTQSEVAETLRGERHAEHDGGEDELIKSILELSRAGLFLGTNSFLWGLVEYALLGENAGVYSEMGPACCASVHGR